MDEEANEIIEPQVAVAVVLRGSPGSPEILFLKRSPKAKTLPGLWNSPGGHVEDNYEEPERAMMRELMEETGLSVVNFHELTRLRGPVSGKLIAFYQVFAGPEEIILNEESTEYRWFRLDEIDRENTTPLGVKIVDLLLSSGDLGNASVIHAENASLRKQVEILANRLRIFGEDSYVDPRDYVACTSTGPPPLKVVFVLKGGDWTFSKTASVKYGRQVRKHAAIGELTQELRPIVEGAGLTWAGGDVFIQNIHTVQLADRSATVDFNPRVMQCMRELEGRIVCLGTLADVAKHRNLCCW